jgi:excisionase family DNA binding protein
MAIRKRANGSLSTGEVGQLLGVERRTVGVWVTSGKITSSRTLGNAVRIHIKDVIGYALDGGVKINRSLIPYSDAELVALGVPKAQVSALK